MAGEIINKEDKGEVTSSRKDEGICLMFHLHKTCLFLDLWTLCLRVSIIPVHLLLILISYAMYLSCWCQRYNWLLTKIFFSHLLYSIKFWRQTDGGASLELVSPQLLLHRFLRSSDPLSIVSGVLVTIWHLPPLLKVSQLFCLQMFCKVSMS
jgi:hypothetical protein